MTDSQHLVGLSIAIRRAFWLFFMMISLGYITSEALFVLEMSAMRRVRYHLTIIWDAVSCWGCRLGYHSHLPRKRAKFPSLAFINCWWERSVKEGFVSYKLSMWKKDEHFGLWNGNWLACLDAYLLILSVLMHVFKYVLEKNVKILYSDYFSQSCGKLNYIIY